MDTNTTELMQDKIGQSCSWYNLPCHLTSFADWLKELALFIPRKLWQLMLEGLATVMESIPVPGFFAQASANLGAIPSSVMWLADYMAFDYALGVFVAAYTLRFVIRRLPVVG